MEWASLEFLGGGAYCPPQLIGHSAHGLEKDMIVFGGFDCDHGVCRNLVEWCDLDSKSWKTMPVVGDVPPPVCRHASELMGSSLYLYGGCNRILDEGVRRYGDLYCIDLQTQQSMRLPQSGQTPGELSGHSLTKVGKCLYLFGGWTGSEYSNDLYILDPRAGKWMKPVCRGAIPLSRCRHSATSANGMLFMCGGLLGDRTSDDFLAIDPRNFLWTDMGNLSTGNYLSRCNHSLNFFSGHLVCTGGFHQSTRYRGALRDTPFFDLDQMTWFTPEITATNSGFFPRESHSSAVGFNGHRLMVFGGASTSKHEDETHMSVLTLSTPAKWNNLCKHISTSISRVQKHMNLSAMIEQTGRHMGPFTQQSSEDRGSSPGTKEHTFFGQRVESKRRIQFLSLSKGLESWEASDQSLFDAVNRLANPVSSPLTVKHGRPVSAQKFRESVTGVVELGDRKSRLLRQQEGDIWRSCSASPEFRGRKKAPPTPELGTQRSLGLTFNKRHGYSMKRLTQSASQSFPRTESGRSQWNGTTSGFVLPEESILVSDPHGTIVETARRKKGGKPPASPSSMYAGYTSKSSTWKGVPLFSSAMSESQPASPASLLPSESTSSLLSQSPSVLSEEVDEDKVIHERGRGQEEQKYGAGVLRQSSGLFHRTSKLQTSSRSPGEPSGMYTDMFQIQSQTWSGNSEVPKEDVSANGGPGRVSFQISASRGGVSSKGRPAASRTAAMRCSTASIGSRERHQTECQSPFLVSDMEQLIAKPKSLPAPLGFAQYLEPEFPTRTSEEVVHQQKELDRRTRKEERQKQSWKNTCAKEWRVPS